MRPRVLAWLAFAATFLVAFVAFAYTPPPIQGHVNDLTGKLTASERADLEQRLEAVNQSSGAEIAVLMIPSLNGETIDDVAYSTFNAWKLGKKNLDNGALLVISTGDRRIRIETGKGVEAQLTDLQTQDIIQHQIGPALKQDRFYDGVRAGTDAIAAAIAGNTSGGATGPPPPTRARRSNTFGLIFIVGFIVVLVLFRLIFGRGRGGGGGFGGGGFGGGDGGGGGGFSGGGGESGGGGSSGSY